MSAPASNDSQSSILGRTLRGALRGVRGRPQELRYHLVRDFWTTTKRFGAEEIRNVEIREIPGLRDRVVETYIDDRNRGVIAGLCAAFGARTFFEIGTNRGRTAWTVAKHNPDIRVYTLDLPEKDAVTDVKFGLNKSDQDFFIEDWDRGDAYRGTPEEARIETLLGDSATFDFSPYEGRMDVVLVDGAHSYDYVRSDTENALRMLSPTGAIIWDDYPAIPGVYQHLTDLAPTLDHPLFHIFETRTVVYSRQDFVERLRPEDYGRLHAA
jgi:predicted O-methyltransferase YrrM